MTLKDRILAEMVIDGDPLEQNFEFVKTLIKLTTDKIIILNKKQIKGKEQILLYLIGKLYTYKTGLTPSFMATSIEIINNLEITAGSFHSYTKRLRELKLLEQTRSHNINCYYVPRYLINKALEHIKITIGD